MKLLEGVRVLDLSRFVSGPYCSMVLGDHGAEIIKVEHAKYGDGTRRWSKPELGLNNPYFLSVNRNKRSIGVDLKQKDGREIVEKIAGVSDVLVHNFKLGSMERMGLGYDNLKRVNPRLIYCEITGYGGEGPYRNRAAFDFPIQAESGLMSVIGERAGAPMKVGVPIIDIVTGLQALSGVQAALYHREKTGEGVKISTSLLESALAAMTNVVSDYIVAGVTPRRWGNGHPNLAPYAAYEASDGWLTVGVATEPQWGRFCDIIGRRDLKSDPRYADNPARLEHRDELDGEVGPEFMRDCKANWLAKLAEADVPSAPLNTVQEIIADPHVTAISMVNKVAHSELGEISMIRSPVSINDEHIPIEHAPPLFAEHTDAVLRDLLHFDDATIVQLRNAGAVR